MTEAYGKDTFCWDTEHWTHCLHSSIFRAQTSPAKEGLLKTMKRKYSLWKWSLIDLQIEMTYYKQRCPFQTPLLFVSASSVSLYKWCGMLQLHSCGHLLEVHIQSCKWDHRCPPATPSFPSNHRLLQTLPPLPLGDTTSIYLHSRHRPFPHH